jgi:alkylation response protein AidB-like acyl-CoA dehydrogenase
MAERVASSCVRWMGGVGFTTDFPQQRYLRASYIGLTYEGTTAMQLGLISAMIEAEYSAKQ